MFSRSKFFSDDVNATIRFVHSLSSERGGATFNKRNLQAIHKPAGGIMGGLIISKVPSDVVAVDAEGSTSGDAGDSADESVSDDLCEGLCDW